MVFAISAATGLALDSRQRSQRPAGDQAARCRLLPLARRRLQVKPPEGALASRPDRIVRPAAIRGHTQIAVLGPKRVLAKRYRHHIDDASLGKGDAVLCDVWEEASVDHLTGNAQKSHVQAGKLLKREKGDRRHQDYCVVWPQVERKKAG